MQVHQEELAYARAYQATHPFERLTEEQLKAIRARGRELFSWFKAHPWLHNAINAGLLAGLLAADYWILRDLPARLLPDAAASAWPRLAVVAVVVGSLHSYLLYSLGIFSLHEGAAHNIVFVGTGVLARVGQLVGNNLARLAASEPVSYAATHMAHHAKFGTEDDAEFLNGVFVKRYLLTFLPLAAFVNISDFIVHRPLSFTPRRLLSAAMSTTYNGMYAWLSYQTFGGLFTAVTFLVCLPHVGFYLDRVRQFTEHNLMPLDNVNGSRSFGLGFWGLLVGGGPWGSPCHWEHHLVPSLPWYQQLLLHRHVVRLLTPTQRAQFLIAPVVGYPALWWRLMRELRASRPADRRA